MQQATQVPFEIVKPQSFYTINGVKDPSTGAYVSVQVTTELLEGGVSRSQKYWAKTGWLGSGSLQFALHETLYDHKGAEGVEELQNLFRGDFRKHFMMTATGITYRAGASDLVTHDSGTSGQRTLEARLAGPGGFISDRMGEEMQVLLGISDVSKIRDVYNWVTGQKSYLWRLKGPLEQNEKRALVLGVDGFNVVFVIGAGDDIGIFDLPARGVRIAPQNSTGSKG